MRKRIVILGAGFGGITAALRLARLRRRGALPNYYAITLVNNTSYHLYTPALYEIASIPHTETLLPAVKRSICIPLTDIIERFPEIELRGGTVNEIDPARRALTLASGETIDFEYAVIALGSETNFSDIPGAAARALPLKTFPDAVRLRNRIEELLRARRRRQRVSVVIAGGGATGVEFAAEAVNFICRIRQRATLRQCNTDVTLIEASEEILPGFAAAIIARARERLGDLGILIRSGTTISRITEKDVIVKGRRRIPYHIFVWAGGVRGVAVLRTLRLPLDGKGRIVVDAFLRAAPGVYAIGDDASVRNPHTNRYLPGNVPVAETEAKLAARNIVAEIRGEPLRPITMLREYPFILAVGGKYAIANLVVWWFAGFFGWVVKQLVELRYLTFILPPARALRVWLQAIRAAISND